ncbi:hypothetical protein JCM19232_1061 [Vibrio ishigakensis]|uniref:Uncharacterized protein n=1 Tax=Vibrio ishigakensis TaxID=1481914 RepID=A0A0B8PDJ5_9VIBR|nr:hypothetical protein JCM19232_1061 [Vibrio ishigakensis]
MSDKKIPTIEELQDKALLTAMELLESTSDKSFTAKSAMIKLILKDLYTPAEDTEEGATEVTPQFVDNVSAIADRMFKAQK